VLPSSHFIFQFCFCSASQRATELGGIVHVTWNVLITEEHVGKDVVTCRPTLI